MHGLPLRHAAAFASSDVMHRASRPFMTLAALRALESGPAGAAGKAAFRFQPPAECLATAEATLRTVNSSLVQQSVATQRPYKGLLERLEGALLLTRGLVHQSQGLDGETLMDLNARRGAVQLVMYNAVQPGQGREAYSRHHSFVLIASFRHAGARLGILMDGSDQQRNVVMSALQSWQAARQDTRPLSELTTSDLAAFDKSVREDKGMALHQLAYRIVDLDEMLSAAATAPLDASWSRLSENYAANADMPNQAIFDPRVTVTSPLLPAAVQRELSEEIEREPSQVERTFLRSDLLPSDHADRSDAK